jgi:hypothetical protein
MRAAAAIPRASSLVGATMRSWRSTPAHWSSGVVTVVPACAAAELASCELLRARLAALGGRATGRPATASNVADPTALWRWPFAHAPLRMLTGRAHAQARPRAAAAALHQHAGWRTLNPDPDPDPDPGPNPQPPAPPPPPPPPPAPPPPPPPPPPHPNPLAVAFQPDVQGRYAGGGPEPARACDRRRLFSHATIYPQPRPWATERRGKLTPLLGRIP